jgi:hypothetical protein
MTATWNIDYIKECIETARSVAVGFEDPVRRNLNTLCQFAEQFSKKPDPADRKSVV